MDPQANAWFCDIILSPWMLDFANGSLRNFNHPHFIQTTLASPLPANLVHTLWYCPGWLNLFGQLRAMHYSNSLSSSIHSCSSLFQCRYKFPSLTEKLQFIPLYMGRERSAPSNYRPVSKLSLKNHQFKEYLNTDLFLLQYQTGFLPPLWFWTIVSV